MYHCLALPHYHTPSSEKPRFVLPSCHVSVAGNGVHYLFEGSQALKSEQTFKKRIFLKNIYLDHLGSPVVSYAGCHARERSFGVRSDGGILPAGFVLVSRRWTS